MLMTSLHPSLETIGYILNFPRASALGRTETLCLFYVYGKHHQSEGLQEYHQILILSAKHNPALR